jgi:hypothetical protein
MEAFIRNTRRHRGRGVGRGKDDRQGVGGEDGRGEESHK